MGSSVSPVGAAADDMDLQTLGCAGSDVGASVLLRPSFLARSFSLAMAESGIGSIQNWSLLTILPVVKDNIFTVPVRFPVGSMTMQSSVRADIVLSVFGTVHCAYSPYPALKSSFASTLLPENSSLGLGPSVRERDTWKEELTHRIAPTSLSLAR